MDGNAIQASTTKPSSPEHPLTVPETVMSGWEGTVLREKEKGLDARRVVERSEGGRLKQRSEPEGIRGAWGR